MLLFNYPALLTISTYHSLIGAIFLYRLVCDSGTFLPDVF